MDMDKLIVRDKTLSISQVNLSLNKPIKFKYNNIINPVFTVKADEYSLSSTKPYTSILLRKIEPNFRLFLEELDEMIPRLAYENRKTWFSSDLFAQDMTTYIENYRKNLSDDGSAGFRIYLGIVDTNDIPVASFIKKNASNQIEPMPQSFQELSWSHLNGDLMLLAQITGLWIKEESYGLSWKVLQILYRRKPKLPKGCLVLTPELIKNHTWTVPPDEPDPVELPPGDVELPAGDDIDVSTAPIEQTDNPDEVVNLKNNDEEKQDAITDRSLAGNYVNPLLETDD
jgi:hypothetical protein